jgi:hypothetical protein
MPWPKYTDEELDQSKISVLIAKNLHQKAWKYRAGKLSDAYMIKYLVKNTYLNLFEIKSLMKDFKSFKKPSKQFDFYSICQKYNIFWAWEKDRKGVDVLNPDYDNVRKIKLKRKTNAKRTEA